jgi:dTDP-4-amino-4,6-dideoxygalactose transaminase
MNEKEKSNEIFKKPITEYLGIENVFLFWKGRVALYAILKAIDIKEGDEIILPAFTCVVVVNPIIYLGAKPVYIDIDPLTLNIDPKKIEEKITKKTKVIIAQNTFGLSSDLDAIFEIAKKYNLFVIEDCAHGFGGTYKGKKNGTISDASFFSSQWNKPFSTGIGGIAVTKNEIIAQKLKGIEAKAVKPNLKEKITLKTLVEIKKRFLKPKIYWFALNTYRKLSQLNLVVGSSQGYEIEKPVEPENFLKGFSDVQAKEGVKYFEKINGKYKIDLIIEHRKKIANLYKKMLLDLDLEPPYEPSYAEHTYLKFPLFVKNRRKFFVLAEKEKIELGDWFISPIHPITKNFELWHYKLGENPIAEFASNHIVNLPTHENIDEKYVERIYNFLKKNRNMILGSNLVSILRGKEI